MDGPSRGGSGTRELGGDGSGRALPELNFVGDPARHDGRGALDASPVQCALSARDIAQLQVVPGHRKRAVAAAETPALRAVDLPAIEARLLDGDVRLVRG